MRTIKRTTQFKRDYKREKRGQHRASLDDELFTNSAVINYRRKTTRINA